MALFGTGGSYFGVSPPTLIAGKALMPQHLRPVMGATMTVTAARYYIAPFYIPKAMTFAGVKTYNSGAGDNGKKIKIGAYSEATAGGPGTRVKDFGEITLTGAAAIRTLASSWTANPGWHYVEWVSDTDPAMYCMSAQHQATAAGFIQGYPMSEMLGAFAADLVGTASSVMMYHGDYVGGTYANFPEVTSLTPTNSIMFNGAASGGFPLFYLYT